MLIRVLTASAALATLSAAAFAADLPATGAPPMYAPPPVPVFTWTGVYVGGQVGYEWGRTNWDTFYKPTDTVIASQPSFNPAGIVGGGHLGYNWQISQFVIGVEGDVDGLDSQGSSLNNLGTHSFRTRVNVDGSVRGRVGFAWDRVLFYGTGGVAFAPINTANTNLTNGLIAQYTDTRVGWTAGGGVEYAVTNNWSIGAEYRYTNYGTFLTNVSAPTGAPFKIGNQVHFTDNRATAGFSYKFDWFAPPAPAVAKY